MQGWSSYLRLKLESRTGFSGSLVVWALIALLGAIATFSFLIVAAFVWLAGRYGPLNAALVIGAFFLVTTVIAAICCIATHRRTIRHAELQLAARSSAGWLSPGLLRVGLQPALLRAGRAVDWRKAAPVLAVGAIGILAAAIGMQWLGRGRADLGDDADLDDGEVRRVSRRAA